MPLLRCHHFRPLAYHPWLLPNIFQLFPIPHALQFSNNRKNQLIRRSSTRSPPLPLSYMDFGNHNQFTIRFIPSIWHLRSTMSNSLHYFQYFHSSILTPFICSFQPYSKCTNVQNFHNCLLLLNCPLQKEGNFLTSIVLGKGEKKIWKETSLISKKINENSPLEIRRAVCVCQLLLTKCRNGKNRGSSFQCLVGEIKEILLVQPSPRKERKKKMES